MLEETKNKISVAKKGKHCSIDTEFKKGQRAWNKGLIGDTLLIGKKRTSEQKLKYSLIMKKRWMDDNYRIRKLEQMKKVYDWQKNKPIYLNSNWQGGKSYEKYSILFNPAFKELINIRDNNSCIICGSDNRLQVHHIDYDKLNTTKENCVSLCVSCHMKTNFNRCHWTKFFQSYLKEHYNYYTLEVINEQ